MRSLFFKILLWFWVAIVTVGVAFVASIYMTQAEPAFAGWSDAMAKAAAVYAVSAAEVYERDGRAGLQAYFNRLDRSAELQPYFYDEHGVELLGQHAPYDLTELLTRAQQSGRREFLLIKLDVFVAQRALTGNAQRYVLVVQTLRRFPFGDRATFRAQLVRVFAILMTVGIVCYALARHLTNPIARLRAATHQFASGDLSTRVGASLGTRRDELADLGHDFDQMAERIESLMSAQRRLLSDISHELRSPLARLSVALELARQRAGVEAESSLNRIEREAQRLNEMIGQLLTLSRLESGAQVLVRQRLDLSRLLEEVAEDADFEARSRQRQVRITQATPCWLNGNEDLLRSAIENVVRNAVRYTGEKTTVELALQVWQGRESSTGESSAQAVLTVRDYGCGVPAEALESIFRPFYRVADARERQSGGVGLGLAIVQRAVHWHGGEVQAHNAVGGGLLVEFKLPVETTVAAPPPALTATS